MLKFESSPVNLTKPKLKIRAARAVLAVFWAITASLTLISAASAQGDFTLQATPFSPDAVAPGGTSFSNVTVGVDPVNGFTGTVALTCQVSAPPVATSIPACAISPATVTPPASASVTITTTLQTTTIGYGVTITGTATATPTDTHTTPPQNLTVLAVTPQFTITVTGPIVPKSVPAGSGAEGTILVNPINGYSTPIINGSQTGITLSCSSITPLVAIPPVCSFSYPKGQNGLPINGVPATSTVTISTSGPQIIGNAARPKTFYALWIPLPMLALAGIGAAVGGKRSRTAYGLLAMFVISGGLLLLPACSNIKVTTSALNGITPANTYTFTVVGVDANGVASSNTSSSNSANPSLSLTVTAPTI
ncbi:MAG TPA: hypothetical protein VFL34_00495 [Candidatus Sulfotelmatobacter sp.]|nr:hypothetical protein [Candidatus Sulfotelmatobacter sp.]